VLVKSYAQVKKKWIVGTITEKVGACHYYIRVEGQLWKQHVDQIRATLVSSENVEEPHRSILKEDMTKLEQEEQFVVSQTEEPTEDERASERHIEVEGEPVLELRRSTRTRKTPQRLNL